MTGDVIKQLREKSGFTQTELAKRLKITRSSVNAWEMGISTPSTQFLLELAAMFHVSTDFLLGIDTEEALTLSGLSDEEKGILYRLVQYFNAQNMSGYNNDRI